MALVLTRRVGETIIIGDNIAVTVVGVFGSQVKISVNAPKEVRVDREEIRARIDREKEGKANDKVLEQHNAGSKTAA